MYLDSSSMVNPIAQFLLKSTELLDRKCKERFSPQALNVLNLKRVELCLGFALAINIQLQFYLGSVFRVTAFVISLTNLTL